MKIICDIDSTLSDHWKRIRRHTLPKWPGGVIDGKAFDRDEVLKDVLLPYCYEVLWRLDRAGHDVTYLSARGWDRAAFITEEQLIRWGLPNPTTARLCRSMAEKVAMLNRDICDVYIDDFTTGQENAVGTFHKQVALDIEAKGIHVIVFRNDWADVAEQLKYYYGGMFK